MRRIVLAVTIMLLFAGILNAQEMTKTKIVADLNSDGKKEKVIEKWSSGSGGSYPTIKVYISEKLAFGPRGVENYLVINNQLVFWEKDWRYPSDSYEPKPYFFYWYKWSKKNNRLVAVRQGATKKAYSSDQAYTEMPKLAASPKNMVISQGATFADDALKIVWPKLRQKGKTVSEIKEQDPWDKNDICGFWVDLEPKKSSILLIAEVWFQRDGKIIVAGVTD